MHPYVKDLSGKRFGMLLVVGPVPRPADKKGRGQYWDCVCECLGDVVVRSDSLVQGWTQSCGCTNAKAANARAAIKPRRTKSTVSEQPPQHRTKSIPETHLDMTENQCTYSDTIGVRLEDLKAMRNTFSNLDASKLLPATMACIAWLDSEISKGEPKARYANENDQPRTVKGETMGEQTERLTANAAEWQGMPSLRLNVQKKAEEQADPRNWPHPGIPPEPRVFDGLKFKPVLNNLSERKHSHYFKKCPYDVVDVYRVLALFGVTDPCFQHALKKILLAGDRKHKDVEKDVQESIDTLVRWQEMQQEDVAAGLAMLDLMKA